MKIRPALLIDFGLMFSIFACNLPAREPVVSVGTNPPLVEAVSPTSTATAIVHASRPANISEIGPVAYDVDDKGTAAEHRAPYGDVYKFNRLERPFTQADMSYLPDVDILHFHITSDSAWHYVTIELIGSNPAGGLQTDYGVEMDFDLDGHGDTLIWAKPPFAKEWSTDRVTAYIDTNNDVGGPSPEKCDAPYPGNGYDTQIFDSGAAEDPDLAWVRIAPSSPTNIQFAFKQSAAESSFLWGVWADAGFRDVAKFSYNDRFTEAEAGSPENDSPYYPIKQLYAVDSTCRMAYGFNPTFYEPLICPPIEKPASTKEPDAPDQPPPPAGCPPHPVCTGIWHEDTCTCQWILE
jgi:hypothetical protein